MPEFVALILAGGSGERFWPLSRQHNPKQFLKLDSSGLSLLQATAARLSPLTSGTDRLYVITGEAYCQLVAAQLPDLPPDHLIVEPVARDTGPAVLYAALRIAALHPDAVMGVFAADHRITDIGQFQSTIRGAADLAAQSSWIITLGIHPTYPATGYGYIEQGEQLGGTPAAFRVRRFTEKPDEQTARRFLEAGGYSWNSGMFMWRISTILHEFACHRPEMFRTLQADLSPKSFASLPKLSIDYAILELSENVVVIPSEFGWDDLGDWNALERLLRSNSPNVVVGTHVGIDTAGALLYTTSGDDLIVTIGLDDVVIVRAGEVTLVVRKDRTQDIKKVVQQLKANPELERFA
jgi:mannose-1-phosphate guanylyltransferase